MKVGFQEGSAVHLPEISDVQETPSVGVEDRSDYFRSGNVKLNDQSLGLPDQEEGEYKISP